MTQGDTLEEIWKNLKEAKELWLEVALEDGMEIQEPVVE
jgi:predicted RNase H-like HicB family nuclease